jgi:hypothetical protein
MKEKLKNMIFFKNVKGLMFKHFVLNLGLKHCKTPLKGLDVIKGLGIGCETQGAWLNTKVQWVGKGNDILFYCYNTIT